MRRKVCIIKCVQKIGCLGPKKKKKKGKGKERKKMIPWTLAFYPLTLYVHTYLGYGGDGDDDDDVQSNFLAIIRLTLPSCKLFRTRGELASTYLPSLPLAYFASYDPLFHHTPENIFIIINIILLVSLYLYIYRRNASHVPI